MLYGQINPHNLCLGDSKYCLHFIEWKIESSKGLGLYPVSKLEREGEEKSTLSRLPLGLELQSLEVGSHGDGKLLNLFPSEIHFWQVFPHW